MDALKNTRIYTSFSMPFRDLDGFEKHHDAPTSITHRALDWLETLSQKPLDEKLQVAFDSIRKTYSLKRRQLDVHGPIERRGVIETPYFNYEISVTLDEDAPDQAVWTTELNHIRESDKIVGPEFSTCFPNSNWNLEVACETELDIERLIDQIEDEDDEEFEVDYDKNLEWCEIRIPECEGLLRATSSSFNVSIKKDATPSRLLIALLQFQTALMSAPRIAN